MKTIDLSKWWSRVGFENAQHGERTLVLGSLIGVGSALLAISYEGLAGRHSGGALPMAAAAMALMVALPRHSKWLLAMLTGIALLTVVVKGMRETSAAFLFAGALGLALAAESKWWVRRVVSLVAPLLAVGWYLIVVRQLGARHLGAAGQAFTIIAQLGAGLFLSLGVVSAELAVAVDDVEPSLRFDQKLRAAWLRLHAAMKRLPVEAHTRMHGVASVVAARWLEAKNEEREAATVTDAQIEQARQAIEQLANRQAITDDAVLKEHFEQSLRVQRDTLEQFDGLRRKRERAEAKAAAEANWLDTAAMTLELTPNPEAVDRLATLSARPAH
ncbi:MAG: hypothetical protein QM817_37975 [Archangium sp.]